MQRIRFEGEQLLEALARAAADARTLHSSIKGSRPDDPRERDWYFPPATVVYAESRRLCAAHDLAIVFTGIEVDPAGRVLTEYTIRHAASGEAMVIRWPGEPMPDAPTVSHGIAAAARYAARSLPAVLFSIPSRADVRADEVVVDGVIMREADVSPAVPPTPSPPKGTEPQGRVETTDPRRLGLGAQPTSPPAPDHDPIALAAEADAAALAVPAAQVDELALFGALTRWGTEANIPARDRLSVALARAHGGDRTVEHLPIAGSAAADARRARVVDFLRAGGWLS
ncbi:hypothetical protein OV203_02595 [Nannocystis sp. ILAH1]|uniref:hypothetical protein n=1 Tax=Nannocystis sp. ILAH1 TaxID=2996789 RepID=UPI002271A67E|nr:hypothetical protein [Nannocystis sp. ILAH1]MCY0986001.1 hypothetical protein [Nannocystis sp. ILAH1]